MLEEQLEKVDREETALLFLGTARRDCNPRRQQVLRDIDLALAEYGRFPTSLEYKRWKAVLCPT